jgi:hypothetical protein
MMDRPQNEWPRRVAMKSNDAGELTSANSH